MSEVRAGSSRFELLPCPFCGGEARVIDDVPSHDRSPWFGIGCASPYCIAFTGYGVQLFDTKAEAIAAWNRRADHD